MLFNVSVLLREGVGATRHYELEPATPLERGAVEFVRIPEGVLVRCSAEVTIDSTCSRCLAPVSYRAPIAFAETFHQVFDVQTGAHIHREPGDPPLDADAFLIDQRHTIDITEALRQYSEVAAEMQPLCRLDCPGLCPHCGHELGRGPCGCDLSTIDPRWGTLAALKQKSNG